MHLAQAPIARKTVAALAAPRECDCHACTYARAITRRGIHRQAEPHADLLDWSLVPVLDFVAVTSEVRNGRPVSVTTRTHCTARPCPFCDATEA